MKLKSCIKKCISLILLSAILVSFDLPYIAHAEMIAVNDSEQEEVCNYLNSYFAEFLDTIQADSVKDYTSEDFSSINGYIVAKYLVNRRESTKKLLGGIEKVNFGEVILEDLSSAGDKMEAMAYVKYSYTYAGDPVKCFVGALYQVILSKEAKSYNVLDLDCHDKEIIIAKEVILGNSDLRNEIVSDANAVSAYILSDTDSALDYAVADAYFAQLEQNAESLSQDDISYAEPEEEEEISTLPTNVSNYKEGQDIEDIKSGDGKQSYIINRQILEIILKLPQITIEEF